MTKKQHLLLLFLWIFPLWHGFSAPSSNEWTFWNQSSDSKRTIDHSSWDQFLKKFVVTRNPNEIYLFKYSHVKQDQKRKLEGYLKQLENTSIRKYSKKEQLAYWLNLYNALTVKVILDNYPVKSNRDIDISPGRFSDGPWKKKLLKVEGQEVSLDDIEHRILRPIWKDPRVHYGVNCASLGCPNLIPQAFTSSNGNRLLTEGAILFINHPRGAKINQEGELIVSSIYHWFKEDFGGNDQGVIKHLKKYAKEPLKSKLQGLKKGIKDHQYDWNLNGLKKVYSKNSSTQKRGKG